jgi:hypothetical protein
VTQYCLKITSDDDKVWVCGGLSKQELIHMLEIVRAAVVERDLLDNMIPVTGVKKLKA